MLIALQLFRYIRTNAIQFLARAVQQASVRLSTDLHVLVGRVKTTQDAVVHLHAFARSREAQRYRAELSALCAEMERHQQHTRTLTHAYKSLESDSQTATAAYFRREAEPLRPATGSGTTSAYQSYVQADAPPSSVSNSLHLPAHRLYAGGLEVPARHSMLLLQPTRIIVLYFEY